MSPVPPRLLVPDDDLYARLELPTDATPEAIEVAWRALLRRHHPDVAGDDRDALERAKRINVAHDWLSDPELRARYDERRVEGLRTHGGVSTPTSRSARGRPVWSPPPTAWHTGGPVRRREDRILGGEPEGRIDRFLERVRRLSDDEYDRMSVTDRPPIAFVATIRRFAPPAAAAELEELERNLGAVVPPVRWSDLAIREAVLGVAAELVLGAFLDDHLTAAFRGRARERLVRAWEAALDQPRYGANTDAVIALRDRAARLTADEAARFVRAAATVRATERPWPAGLDPEEDEGLHVSAMLADRDVAAAPSLAGVAAPTATRTRRLLGRLGHATALRHAHGPATYAAMLGPWRTAVGDGPADDDGRVGVRQGRGPRVRRR
jgi:hypothetical protein